MRNKKYEHAINLAMVMMQKEMAHIHFLTKPILMPKK